MGFRGARGLWGCALALLASSCSYAPRSGLVRDPFESRRKSELAVFEVDWWARLVTDVPLLEYVPREPASPAVDAETGRVIALTRDGWVRCLRADGTPDWKYRLYSRFGAGARVENGVAYVPGSNGKLIAFQMTTGQKLWEYDSGEELITVPVLADGKLYVASQNDTLFVVNQQTGKWEWQYRRDSPAGFTIRGVSTPRVQAGKVFIGFADGHLVSLAAGDGALLWDHTLSTGTQFLDVDSSPALDADGNLFVASFKDGLFKVSGNDGHVLWSLPLPGLNNVTLFAGVLYVGGNEQVIAISTLSGAFLWKHALKSRPARTPVFAEGLMILPTTQELLFLDPASGRERLRFDPGYGISATPALAGKHLFVLSNNGYLYDLRLGSNRS